jgi:rhodanese-related sulfurtransferase
MNTVSSSVDPPVVPPRGVATAVAARELAPLHATARWPLVIDVRRTAAYEASPSTIAGALRCPPERIDAVAAVAPAGTPVVCCCVHGHEVSQGAAHRLAALGRAARWLDGGIEAWGQAGLPTRARLLPWPIPEAGGSTWVTRERPKVDRIACPWLVRRFVDPRARIVYLPTPDVLPFAAATGAVAFDIPGGAVTHDGEACSFDTLARAAGLADPALARMARIVRGADTDRLALAPQAAGLLAISLGLSRTLDDDQTMLEAAMPLYDALYGWARDGQADTHDWRPEVPR